MNIDRDALEKAILENPSIVIEYAKQANAELLDECFDILFRSVKNSINEFTFVNCIIIKYLDIYLM